ncbi:ABC transporter ATP-binding protein/permease [Glaciecola sp. 1036]|uniref:ABC transporter ATP-binding protein/permease n=1 Tax=Alteromonadaceae TaxID=72275 RepID=UPI003D0158EC
MQNNQSPISVEQTRAWLNQLAKPYRQRQLQILGIKILQLVAQVSAFWFFAHQIHLVVVEQQAILFTQFTPMLIAIGSWAICAWVADFLALNTKHKIEADLEQKIHQVLNQQQLAITRQYSATFWQQLLLENVPDIAQFFTQYNVQKWLSGIAPILVLVVIFPIHYVVGLTLVFTLPLVPLFMILVGKGAANLHKKHFLALERLGDMFSDRLKAMPLITASFQHEQQTKRIQDASAIVNRKTMSVVSVAFLSNTVLDFFATISIALVAVFIGFTMLGEINLGPAISLHHGLFMLLVSPLLFSELRALGKFYHQKAKAEAGADRLLNVLVDIPQPQKQSHFTGIAWLNYRVHTPTLVANKLQLSAGDWVSLNGRSGAGKTALLEALMGFRQASHKLSGDLALMTQETKVLNASLRDNLSMGHALINDGEILQALDEVELTQWYSKLPYGLDTCLGEYPLLSGGEAHRLALARILLQNKECVLLDEPTAHLTQDQHQQIAHLIHKKLMHKTVIWASHKSLPESWFNQSWHVEDGRISSR